MLKYNLAFKLDKNKKIHGSLQKLKAQKLVTIRSIVYTNAKEDLF